MLAVLSIIQAIACMVFPSPGESWADQLLDHPNFGLLGSGVLCLLALASRGVKQERKGS
jgi:hypothetical protein